ncbi:uncharacterized protein LOC130626160 [Hydractinia symbiolongicarpus]|uniref:uncharacterized protein LOC130626160 n=1 Tax=Hydractinia symbiolongicarpus TaxID=13093 RepID=UPI0025510B97|nr:uncharacterized protein LOC130626160 [Hydractinia symbiolongicarpus]
MMYDNRNIVGTWFPTGFHGHFRSKSRNNFNVPYREYAKPTPPSKFLNRTKMRSDQHLFSRHDNRNSHSNAMGDLEIHFNMGMGKKKPLTSQHSKNTSTLLDWGTDTNRFPNQRTFLRRPRAQSAIITTTYERVEPVHTRRNPHLQRRRYITAPSSTVLRTAPLLAWNTPSDEASSFKPCIGDSTKRNITCSIYDPVKTKTLITERTSLF